MSEFKNFHVIKTKLEIGAALTWATTAVDIVNDTITINSHGLSTGQPCGLSTTGTVPSGLTALTTPYYVIVINSNKIELASSLANALAGTAIDLTTVGTGVGSLHPNGLGTVGLKQFVPAKCIVTRAWYDVVTTFTSPTGVDNGTIALQVNAANDLVSTLAISDARNMWDAGIHSTLDGSPIVGSNASTLDAGTAIIMGARQANAMIKTTADRELTAVLATDVVTAGKLNLYVEYLLSE